MEGNYQDRLIFHQVEFASFLLFLPKKDWLINPKASIVYFVRIFLSSYQQMTSKFIKFAAVHFII